MDYPDLDPDEPRRIELLDAGGTVFRTILASINFCIDVLPTLPSEIYPEGSTWRVEAPPDEADE
ncbi:hypothetical protein [Duganella sp. LjRoot269]|uniref:hypothetical protein n=1 Tax=Duganella sp. LjRoot269 TaxID=3342305 RepID=UPI003ECD34C0